MSGFELQPILAGELVRLRPLAPQDFEPLFSVAADPLIWQQHPRKNRYKREVFDGFFRDAIASGGALLALDARSDEVIGSSRYHNFKPELSEVEVGYTFLSRRCWGHTFNREMKRLMLRHAFRFVEKVDFVIGEQNLRSRKAVEKLGAVFLTSFYSRYPDGVTYRSVRYRIKREVAGDL